MNKCEFILLHFQADLAAPAEPGQPRVHWDFAKAGGHLRAEGAAGERGGGISALRGPAAGSDEQTRAQIRHCRDPLAHTGLNPIL